MATTSGNDGLVKVGSNTVAEVRNFNFTTTANTADDTAMGDDWETHKVTQKSWEGSVACWWDETDTNGQEALTEGASVTLNLYPEGDTSGDKYYSGTVTVTQINHTQAHDGIVERSFNFKGNGALTGADVT